MMSQLFPGFLSAIAAGLFTEGFGVSPTGLFKAFIPIIAFRLLLRAS